MTLIKTIAGHFDQDRNWIEQKDVEMHSLEEKAMRLHWAIHDVIITVPLKPSQAQEHELLIQQGADAVKKARADWQLAYDALRPNVEVAEKAFQAAHDYWNSHVSLCTANGHNPDTFQGDANLLLNKEGSN